MYGIDGVPLALVVGIDHVPGLSVWIDGYQVMLVFRVTKILPVLLFRSAPDSQAACSWLASWWSLIAS